MGRPIQLDALERTPAGLHYGMRQAVAGRCAAAKILRTDIDRSICGYTSDRITENNGSLSCARKQCIFKCNSPCCDVKYYHEYLNIQIYVPCIVCWRNAPPFFLRKIHRIHISVFAVIRQTKHHH